MSGKAIVKMLRIQNGVLVDKLSLAVSALNAIAKKPYVDGDKELLFDELKEIALIALKEIREVDS